MISFNLDINFFCSAFLSDTASSALIANGAVILSILYLPKKGTRYLYTSYSILYNVGFRNSDPFLKANHALATTSNVCRFFSAISILRFFFSVTGSTPRAIIRRSSSRSSRASASENSGKRPIVYVCRFFVIGWL